MDQLKEAAMKLKDKIAKNPLERALNDATADVNWNASNKVLQEIADQTYVFNDFTEITKFIWKKIGSERKQWRKILKTLTLIEYLIRNGSPRCVQEFRDEIYQIRSLQEFSHYEENQDKGGAIREISKRIVQTLNDDQKIDEERKKAQEIRERLGGGNLGAIGSNSKGNMGGGNSFSSNSNRYESYSSENPKKSGYGVGGAESSRNYGTSSDKNQYDDKRKEGKWRVEKTEEPSHKSREPERDDGGDFVVKSGTKYDINLAGGNSKEAEKPKATLNGNKLLPPPKGGKIAAPAPVQQQQQQQQQQHQEVNFLDDPVPISTNTNTNTNTASNDPFNWNAPEPVKAADNNQWNWGQQNNTQSVAAQPPAATNNGGFNWNQGQQNPVQPQQPVINPIQNLYQQPQQPTSNPFGFPSQPTNQFNNPQPTPPQNLTSQFNQLSFGSNPSGSFGSFNANPSGNIQSNPAPASTNFNFPSSAPKDDGFDSFQTASTNAAPKQTEYKNYSQAEKSIIDLSDITNEASKKKEQKEKVIAVKNSNEGFLYSTNEEMDNFFGSNSQQNTGLGMNAGMNAGMGMNIGMGMQGNMGGMAGFNQGFNNPGMRNMGGAPQQMGMYPMGGMQPQMGMNAGFSGSPGLGQNFNPMMQGGFPNQNANFQQGMNSGFGFR